MRTYTCLYIIYKYILYRDRVVTAFLPRSSCVCTYKIIIAFWTRYRNRVRLGVREKKENEKDRKNRTNREIRVAENCELRREKLMFSTRRDWLVRRGARKIFDFWRFSAFDSQRRNTSSFLCFNELKNFHIRNESVEKKFFFFL